MCFFLYANVLNSLNNDDDDDYDDDDADDDDDRLILPICIGLGQKMTPIKIGVTRSKVKFTDRFSYIHYSYSYDFLLIG